MDSQQFAALVAEADTQLSKLRSLYDQWFSGVERFEPQQQRDAFDRLMSTLQRECPNNTASRFRHQQLVQRYVTYTTYWRRVGRQIEEGTYKRDVVKARKQHKERLEPLQSKKEARDVDLDLEMELDMDAILESASALAPPLPESTIARKAPLTSKSDDKPRSQAPPPRARSTSHVFAAPRFRRPDNPPTKTTKHGAEAESPRAASQESSSSAAGQLTEGKMRELYDRYLVARAKNNERTDNVKFDTIAKSVEGMMPKLLQKHAGKQIDFEVVLRDGKVALKPVAK